MSDTESTLLLLLLLSVGVSRKSGLVLLNTVTCSEENQPSSESVIGNLQALFIRWPSLYFFPLPSTLLRERKEGVNVSDHSLSDAGIGSMDAIHKTFT
jgi:hypothetical protein